MSDITSNSSPTNTGNEEISFIDMFATLIRYRKMIIIGTLVSIVATALLLFILPHFIPKLQPDSIQYTYYIRTDKAPGLYSRLIPNSSLENTLKAYFSDPLTMLLQNSQNNIFFTNKKLETMSPSDCAAAIASLITSNMIEAKTAAFPNTVMVSLTVPKENAPYVPLFITNTVAEIERNCRVSFDQNLSQLYEKNMKSVEQLGAGDTSKNTATEAYASLIETINEINILRTTDYTLYTIDETVFEYPVKKGRAKIALIIVFAAFFVLVAIAFALSGIEQVKADPEASKKIQQAWNAGK